MPTRLTDVVGMYYHVLEFRCCNPGAVKTFREKHALHHLFDSGRRFLAHRIVFTKYYCRTCSGHAQESTHTH